MTLIQTLKSLFNHRLTVVAEEFFGEVETIVREYEEEVVYLKQQIEQKQRTLDLFLQPVIKVHRAGWYISLHSLHLHYNFRAQ